MVDIPPQLHWFYEQFGKKPESRFSFIISIIKKVFSYFEKVVIFVGDKWSVVLLISFTLILGYVFFIASPGNASREYRFVIEKGQTLDEVSKNLKEARLIRSPNVFKGLAAFFGGERRVLAGTYSLESGNAVRLAYRLAGGHFGIPLVKLTIPEGTNTFELAKLVNSKINSISEKDFEKYALQYEGFLFPDTYYFHTDASINEIISEMRENFEEVTKPFLPRLAPFGKDLKDVVTMASILEEEARTMETRRTIAGILWKRISIGMALQVDAPFAYISDKSTFELTTKDLKKDGPYNTYTRTGLTPTPITNPGLDAIEASITPIKSDWLYYLSDKEGNMHYAKTHDEHVANKQKYLR